MFKSIFKMRKTTQSGHLAAQQSVTDPIQLQVFVGEPHHFTIHSHYPLIKSGMDGRYTLNDPGCFIKINHDTIELKLKLIKEDK